MSKVLLVVNSDSDLPNFKRTSFYTLLCNIGFQYVKRNRKNIVIDREDIILWWRDYLRKIRSYRKRGCKIYYLNETWNNEGYTTSQIWIDPEVKSKKQAFLSGLSTGLKTPAGKLRLIVLHIGSEDGFLEGGLLLFLSKKTDDYHE